jgi:hypothetical protein
MAKRYIDHISTVRDKEETLVKQSFMASNNRLKASGKKTLLRLRIGDCWPSEILYGPKEDDVFLNEHRHMFPEKITQTFVKLPYSLYGAHYLADVNWEITIDRDFNWFTKRNDPNRQFFFYDLYKHGWINDGYVSFLGHRISGNKTCFSTFDKIHRDYYAPFYHTEYQNIRTLLPYQNFHDTGNLCDIILQSKFSIVNETYIDRADVICFSEKIFRVLQMPRPWLLLGTTESVGTLRDLGFYVFDDFVDHTYDSIDTSNTVSQKHSAILEQARVLRRLVITKSMISHWKYHTQKNRDLMRHWNQIMHTESNQVFRQAEEIAHDIG